MVIDILEDELKATLRDLSPERQQQVLDFALFLRLQQIRQVPPRSMFGALKHLRIDIPFEDFAEARREMSANFPREID